MMDGEIPCCRIVGLRFVSGYTKRGAYGYHPAGAICGFGYVDMLDKQGSQVCCREKALETLACVHRLGCAAEDFGLLFGRFKTMPGVLDCSLSFVSCSLLWYFMFVRTIRCDWNFLRICVELAPSLGVRMQDGNYQIHFIVSNRSRPAAK
jgi:hypothetical protein